MIRRIEVRAPLIVPILRAAVLIAVAALIGGCFSIPERAWRNGEAMSGSRALQAVQGGDMGFAAHRALESSLNPRRIGYPDLAYPPFGKWWY